MKLFKLINNLESDDIKETICYGEALAENTYQFIERDRKENIIRFEVLSDQSVKLFRKNADVSMEVVMVVGQKSPLIFTELSTNSTGEYPVRVKDIEFDFDNIIRIHYVLMYQHVDMEEIDMKIVPWSE